MGLRAGRRFLIPTALALLGAVSGTGRSAPMPARAQAPDSPCPQDRLYNGAFEGGFDDRGRPEIQVALGWQPWAQGLDLSDPASGLRYLPLGRRRAQDSARVLQGWWAQGLEGLPAGGVAGLWQRVRLPLAAKVLVYAWGGVGSDALGSAAPPRGPTPIPDAPNGEEAAPPPDAAWLLRLGWDPAGGSDPGRPGLSWTAPVTLTTGWAPLALPPFEAEGTVGTLFLEGRRLDGGRGAADGQLRWDGACVGLLDAPPLPTVPSPVPLMTLDPRSPEPPPIETLAIVLAGQSQATAAAVAAAARATARAAAGGGGRTAGGAASFLGGGQHGPVPEPPPPAEPGLAAQLYDASGLLLLLLAAALGGLMAAGRHRSSGPSAR